MIDMRFMSGNILFVDPKERENHRLVFGGTRTSQGFWYRRRPSHAGNLAATSEDDIRVQ